MKGKGLRLLFHLGTVFLAVVSWVCLHLVVLLFSHMLDEMNIPVFLFDLVRNNGLLFDVSYALCLLGLIVIAIVSLRRKKALVALPCIVCLSCVAFSLASWLSVCHAVVGITLAASGS